MSARMMWRGFHIYFTMYICTELQRGRERETNDNINLCPEKKRNKCLTLGAQKEKRKKTTTITKNTTYVHEKTKPRWKSLLKITWESVLTFPNLFKSAISSGFTNISEETGKNNASRQFKISSCKPDSNSSTNHLMLLQAKVRLCCTAKCYFTLQK